MNFFTKTTHFLFVILFLFTARQFFGQMVVDTTVTKEQMVEMLVDKGVFYENVELQCPTVARGIFTHPEDQSNLSLGEGIILTTGKATYAMGPNYSGSKSHKNKVEEVDEDLAKLNDSTKKYRDRCKLEFDVTPTGNEITFNYVFGSEEYPEYVATAFNDVFGFFVSGPGIKGPFSRNGVNIAVIGKNLPVAVNTINMGREYYKNRYKDKYKNKYKAFFDANSDFSNLYVDNVRGGSNSIGYDGFTKTLQAKIKVIPCQKYHFKLVIADLGDASVDTGGLH